MKAWWGNLPLFCKFVLISCTTLYLSSYIITLPIYLAALSP